MGKKVDESNAKLVEILDILNHGSTTVAEVKKILDNGADVDSAYDKNGTPVVYSVVAKQPLEIAKLILEKSTQDVNFKSDDEYALDPLIFFAADNKDLRVFALLINEYQAECPLSGDFNPVHKICNTYSWIVPEVDGYEKPSVEDFYTYLNNECHIDAQNIFWNAARADIVDLVKYVAETKDVDVEAFDENGDQAIHMATKLNGLEVLKWLIEEKNVDQDTMNTDGKMPIHCACEIGEMCKEVIEYLVENNRDDQDVQSESGEYPIHYVTKAMFKNVRFLDFCVNQLGFDFDAEDCDGWKPLTYEICYKDADCVKFYVQEYDKFQGCDGIKEAYNTAVRLDRLEYVEFLNKECGFSLKNAEWIEHTERDESGCEDWDVINPMRTAIDNENVEIIDYFMNAHYGEKTIKLLDNSPIFYAKDYSFSIFNNFFKYYSAEEFFDRLLDEYDGVWESFCIASRLNEIKYLKYLVEKKEISLASCYGDDGRPYHGDNSLPNALKFPVHAAIENGNMEIVKYLLEVCHANPHDSSYNDGSPMLFAAKTDHPEIIDYLAKEYSCDVESAVLGYAEDEKYQKSTDIIDKYGVNPSKVFAYTAMSNVVSLDYFELLYQKYKIDLSYKTDEGNTAFMNALAYGNLELTKWLIEYCDVNPLAIDEKNRTVLHYSAQSENPDLVSYLLENLTLDVDAKTKSGHTALQLAIEGRNLGAEENCKIIKLLVEHGADINAVIPENGATIAHYWASNTFIPEEMLEWAVPMGLDLTKKDNDKRAPIHVAAESSLERVQTLVNKYGIDPNTKGLRSESNALLVAAKAHQVETVQWLVEEFEMDVNSKNKSGETVLMCAAESCGDWRVDDEDAVDLIRWLVDKGANYKKKDKFGWTLLHSAADSGNLHLVKYVVEELGMNPTEQSDGGSTPADLAKGNRKLVSYLHKKEKEINSNKK